MNLIHFSEDDGLPIDIYTPAHEFDHYYGGDIGPSRITNIFFDFPNLGTHTFLMIVGVTGKSTVNSKESGFSPEVIASFGYRNPSGVWIYKMHVAGASYGDGVHVGDLISADLNNGRVGILSTNYESQILFGFLSNFMAFSLEMKYLRDVTVHINFLSINSTTHDQVIMLI